MAALEVSGWTIPDSALEETFDTSGGPGGQHANRSNTAVRLRLTVADAGLDAATARRVASRLGEVVEVVAAESRSQHRNRLEARKRMVRKLESALVERRPRRKTKPGRRAREQRLSDKRARSRIKRMRRRPGLED